ncbi:MAG: hypothetical protein CVU88_05470 [Firmicutes bacterium HGW-Firmicutes-13]|nr:MAG: hypothetical protein CVU88_05470 [Firmicutes bacterium HGW-Firmicutes-13]
MRRDIKLIISMFMNFVYSVSILGAVFFYSLMGTVAMDRLSIIITEATGFQRQEKMLTGYLSPIVIQNLFWLSLAGIIFCLIFLYFLHQSAHIFWAPATISVMLFFVLQGVKNLIMNLLPEQIEAVPTTPYVLLVIDRFFKANIGLLVFGVLLAVLAYIGNRYFINDKAANSF